MEIRLDRIQAERFEWSEGLTVPVEELAETDLVALSEVQCRGRIERTSNTSFLLTATLEYQQTLACVRCLREIEQQISTEIQLLITVGKSQIRGASRPPERAERPAKAVKAVKDPAVAGVHLDADGEELELAEEDLNLVTVPEPLIDTRPIVIEQLHLAIPMKPLCREDCKGLCNQCGADLNEGSCGCGPVGDVRLAKLAALRGKLGGDDKN
jgi:uncharacterized protein